MLGHWKDEGRSDFELSGDRERVAYVEAPMGAQRDFLFGRVGSRLRHVAYPVFVLAFRADSVSSKVTLVVVQALS